MGFAYAGQWGPEALVDTNGRPYVSLAYTVVLTGTSTPAALYTDRTKGTPQANPGLMTSARGNASFFADPGTYDITVSGVVVISGIVVLPDRSEPVEAARPKRIPYATLSAWPGTPNQQLTAAVADLLSSGGHGEIVIEAGSTPYDFAPFALPPGITKLRGEDPEKCVIRNTSTTTGQLIACYGSGQSVEGLTMIGQSALQPYGTTGAIVQFAKPNGTSGGGAISGGLLLASSVANGATSLPVTTASWSAGGYTVAVQPGEYVTISQSGVTEIARIASTYVAGSTPISLDSPLKNAFTTAAAVSVRCSRCGVLGSVVRDGIFVGIDLWATIGGYVRDTSVSDCIDTCVAISEGGARLTSLDRLFIDTNGRFGVGLDSVDFANYGRTGLIGLGSISVRLRPKDSRLSPAERDGVLILGASNVTADSIRVDLSAYPSSELAGSGVRFTTGGSGYHFGGLAVIGPGGAHGVQTNTYGVRFSPPGGTCPSVDAVINGGVLEGLFRGVETVAISDATVRNMVMRSIADYAVNITSHGTIAQRLAVENNVTSNAFVGLAASPAPAAGSILHKRGNIYRSMGYLSEAVDSGWTVNP